MKFPRPSVKEKPSILGLLLTQILVGLYAFFAVYVNGFDTYSESLFRNGVVAFLIAIFSPIPFICIAAKKKQSLRSFIVPLLVSLVLFCLMWKQVRPSPTPEQVTAQKSYMARTEYNTILKDDNYKQREIVGWEYANTNPPANVYILKTDQSWGVYMKIQYNDAVISYIEKKVIGHRFDVIVPPFDEQNYPIGFYRTWVCKCDILVDGKPLSPLLEKIYQDTQNK